ncbi:MAG: hypothetical protein KDI92_03145 [Xanthomonadales bacterium]|nr:hypothetical protein [Xanthomonadales bacterium]
MKKNKLQHMVFLLIVLLTACQSLKHENKGNGPAAVTSTKNIDTQPDYSKSHIENVLVNHVPVSITRNVIEDSNGHIWIASWEGVFKYNGHSFQHITKDVSQARFFAIMEDSRNNFWLASIGSGVFYYDGQSFKNYNTSNGLINDRVTNIFEDKAGRIWFGTEGGISIFDGTTFRHLTTADGLSDNRVNSIIEDAMGKFWIGTMGQAVIYDPTFGTFTDIVNDDGQFFNNVRQVMISSKGDVWLAGSNGLWCYNHISFTQYSPQFTGFVFEDSSGNILTSSSGSTPDLWVLTLFSENHWFSTEILEEKGMIFGVLKDTFGQIWYGTLNGLYRFDGKSIYHYVTHN